MDNNDKPIWLQIVELVEIEPKKKSFWKTVVPANTPLNKRNEKLKEVLQQNKEDFFNLKPNWKHTYSGFVREMSTCVKTDSKLFWEYSPDTIYTIDYYQNYLNRKNEVKREFTKTFKPYPLK